MSSSLDIPQGIFSLKDVPTSPNFAGGRNLRSFCEEQIVSGMKEGVYAWVTGTLDTKDELALQMIEAGVEPGQAILASSVVVKGAVREALDRHLGEQSASAITHGLKTKRGVQPRIN